ncbi:hypothetical protein P7H12_21525 [Paenibacillus larvae]|nr:hypothetical protein [Paenibacillus larvae]MDT2265642.1 hypothetical protein [Paenibacillus larvae]
MAHYSEQRGKASQLAAKLALVSSMAVKQPKEGVKRTSSGAIRSTASGTHSKSRRFANGMTAGVTSSSMQKE